MLTEERLQEIEKDAKTNHYFNSHKIVHDLRDMVSDIRTLQQQNKQLVEGINKMTEIDPDKYTFYQYLYYVCSIEAEVMEYLKGESHDS